MVLRSLPYMGLIRNNPGFIHKIVEAERERYIKFQAEAKEKDMHVEPCLEGYNFIHKTDNSKNYFMPSGVLNASAIAKDLIPVEPMVGGALQTYDRDIDVSAMVITKQKRRFGAIDRAVKKAKQEMTEEKLEIEARKKRTYKAQMEYTTHPMGINPQPIKEALGVIQQFGDMLRNQEIVDLDPHGWIQLYSGRKFFPMDPKVEDIDIEDIAHSLSNMCRFTGHCKEFYSVAQHSVLVSYLVGGHALYGLLHDASEAYMVDMPRPIKRLKEMQAFRDMEHKVMMAVCKKFNLPPTEPPVVKLADTQMLATEARDLMSPLHPDWNQPIKPLPFRIDPLSPKEAKKLFLERYRELTENNDYK